MIASVMSGDMEGYVLPQALGKVEMSEKTQTKFREMEANKIQSESEDEWHERINKYKTKYKSAKVHLKQLKVQSNEYRRAMKELKVQNDKLRNIIGQLQQQQQRTLSNELTALRFAFKEQQTNKPGAAAVGIGAGAG